MAFDTTEASIYEGEPIELYLFKRGTDVWAWTSSDITVTHQSIEYLYHQITRTEITLEGRVGADDLQVTVPRTNPVAGLFRHLAPALTVELTVFRAHRNDLSDVVTIWKGRVRSVRWAGSEAVLLCDLVTAALSQEGPRKLYQRLCPHMLYDARCTVTASEFSVSGSVGDISGDGTVLTVSAATTKEDGFWVPGYVKRGADDYRLVIAHEGSSLTLMVPFENLLPGEPLELFAGCNRSAVQCFERFDNIKNFGGFPFLPNDNPFNTGFGFSTDASGEKTGGFDDHEVDVITVITT